MDDTWLTNFKGLSRLPAGIRAELEAGSDIITVPAGTRIFSAAQVAEHLWLLLEGIVKVQQRSETGREVFLYRVHAGESCVLTTACLLAGKPYSGYGYAEGEMTGVAIPAERFRTLLTTDARFQELVFRGFAARVGELTDVIDDLLEHRTDLRLARWLSVRGSTEIHMTQQEVAQELGTAREVVSRTLKSFETQGWIKLGRRSLTVIDALALAQHGQAHEL